jgi:hypothetical protein
MNCTFLFLKLVTVCYRTKSCPLSSKCLSDGTDHVLALMEVGLKCRRVCKIGEHIGSYHTKPRCAEHKFWGR